MVSYHYLLIILILSLYNVKESKLAICEAIATAHFSIISVFAVHVHSKIQMFARFTKAFFLALSYDGGIVSAV